MAHSELDRSIQMQQPTTESKNSSVRYKKKRMGGNISEPNMSTEENCSLMDTLCSEQNRSSQMLDSSVAILDWHSESTSPLTSGKSCQDSADENGGGQAFGTTRRSPSRKISCDQRSVGIETDAICDKEEVPDAEHRDLRLSQGVKTIIKTGDTVIKIFDSSLSIRGMFKEVVVHLNETKAPRNVVADVAMNADTCNTQRDFSQPQHAAVVVNKDKCVDVGVGTSPEFCTASDFEAGCAKGTTRSVQLQSWGTNTTYIENEHFQRELQKCDGVCANTFVEVGSQCSAVPPETISRSKTCLPGRSIASLGCEPSCARDEGNVDPRRDSNGQLLEAVNEQSIFYVGDDNAGIRLGYSERGKCDETTSCEDTLQSVSKSQVQPVVTGEAYQQDHESVAVSTAETPESEGHSGGLDLDECEISPAADSSTIVDDCSPDCPLPGDVTLLPLSVFMTIP